METSGPITLTPNAIHQLEHLLKTATTPTNGIRVSVIKGGCSGLSYDIQYLESLRQGDEIITLPFASPSQPDKQALLVIGNESFLHILGTEMDYIKEPFNESFVFQNPNAKGSCGCGKSFTV